MEIAEDAVRERIEREAENVRAGRNVDIRRRDSLPVLVAAGVGDLQRTSYVCAVYFKVKQPAERGGRNPETDVVIVRLRDVHGEIKIIAGGAVAVIVKAGCGCAFAATLQTDAFGGSVLPALIDVCYVEIADALPARVIILNQDIAGDGVVIAGVGRLLRMGAESAAQQQECGGHARKPREVKIHFSSFFILPGK